MHIEEAETISDILLDAAFLNAALHHDSVALGLPNLVFVGRISSKGIMIEKFNIDNEDYDTDEPMLPSEFRTFVHTCILKSIAKMN